MRRASRAAALSAAAFLFCAAGFASPATAQRANAHEGGSLSAQSLGLDDTIDPATPGDVEDQLPVVTHAIARSMPRNLLDQQLDESTTRERDGRSLADLVGDHQSVDTLDEETDCLARAVYWESKGEPLVGQLAVADVIINRAQSGRFASTLCGVVRQRSQFSFVHGGNIPAAPQGSSQWRTAVAIARIARQDLAGDAAPQALFFHARSVHPGWRLTRVASVGNHIFYR
jgi:N-acetylmuramoyl-L-alanine amidase